MNIMDKNTWAVVSLPRQGDQSSSTVSVGNIYTCTYLYIYLHLICSMTLLFCFIVFELCVSDVIFIAFFDFPFCEVPYV